jgi:hypothetical protein
MLKSGNVPTEREAVGAKKRVLSAAGGDGEGGEEAVGEG